MEINIIFCQWRQNWIYKDKQMGRTLRIVYYPYYPWITENLY